MTVDYADASSPEAINGRNLLEQRHALQDFAAETNELFKLPKDIPLHGAQCEQPNAFWDPAASAITICYEDTDTNYEVFSQAGDPDPAAAAVGTEEATFAHELGHMVIDLYDLPATGREEDVADQLSAYLLL